VELVALADAAVVVPTGRQPGVRRPPGDAPGRGTALTRKEVLRALSAAGADHGAGTVAKALADLTASRELVSRRDNRGYRLPEWIKPRPGLFDEE
jgi:hypothetical protein